MKNEIKYNVDWVKNQVIPEFVFFWGHKSHGKTITKSCLSQFYPCRFKKDGIVYNCAEQYMMSEKAKVFKDEEAYQLILSESAPAQIKKYGRQIKNFNDEEWNKHKIKTVVEGNVLKFSQNEDLKEFLIETGDKILVEASPHDRIWGIGIDANNPDANNPNKWKGENLLGFSLMEVRDIIKNK